MEGDDMRETAKITKISEWSHELHMLIMAFKNRYGVFPNIMLANDETYRRIDMLANTNSRKSIRTPEGKIPEGPVVIKIFSADVYHVNFCLKFELELYQVILIHDDGSGDGGEPTEEEMMEAI